MNRHEPTDRRRKPQRKHVCGAPEYVKAVPKNHPPTFALEPERARQRPRAGADTFSPIRDVKALAKVLVRVQVIVILTVNGKHLPQNALQCSGNATPVGRQWTRVDSNLHGVSPMNAFIMQNPTCSRTR